MFDEISSKFKKKFCKSDRTFLQKEQFLEKLVLHFQANYVEKKFYPRIMKK